MVKLIASILAANFARLGDEAQKAERAGIDGIQVDVMDGRFVPNITFGPGVVSALRPLVAVPIDADLMIVQPDDHLSAFAQAGADRVTVHLESCTHPHRTLQAIRKLGRQASASISPGTPVVRLEAILDVVDAIQIMTVDPGWGGQEFLQSQLETIRRLKDLLDRRNLAIPIAVDGGINPITAPLAASAGATELVTGSSLYNSRASLGDNLEAIRHALSSM
jgi:ribulose-phosphate 3-epimerase